MPMTLDELIRQGWADHAHKPADVAERLEAHVDLVQDDNGAAGFLNLAGHVIGDHLGERERATRLCEAAIRRLPSPPGTGPCMFLAVARALSGDEAGAQAARAQAGDDPTLDMRIGLLVAQGLMHGGDWEAAAALYAEQMAAAEQFPEGHAGERACAIVSNNIASEALGLPRRTAAQARLMEQAAMAARTYWLRVGTWVNDERADYLLTGVHHALGNHAQARSYAERGLATIAANGEEKVDEAFLHLARARACRDLGDRDAHAASLERARSLAGEFQGDGLVSWFQDEWAKAQ